MKINLDELSEEQAYIIKEALELYARIGMGQFNAIDTAGHLILKEKNPNINKNLLFKQLKELYFPELKSGESYSGMTNDTTHESSRVAWDMVQVLRHDLSWHKHPEGGYSVNYDEPLKTSKEELIKCYIKE